MLTLRGRLETRTVLTLTVGLPWSIALALALHAASRDPGRATHTAGSASVLTLLMLALGLGWELVYHGLQQLRRDKDWPSLVALLAVTVELGPLWSAAGRLPEPATSGHDVHSFLLITLSAWLVMWTCAQGPMRVLLLRWRMAGGRVLAER
jgi:hypothetical protein